MGFRSEAEAAVKVFDMGRGLAKYEVEGPRVLDVPELPPWLAVALSQYRAALEAEWDRWMRMVLGPEKPCQGGR